MDSKLYIRDIKELVGTKLTAYLQKHQDGRIRIKFDTSPYSWLCEARGPQPILAPRDIMRYTWTDDIPAKTEITITDAYLDHQCLKTDETLTTLDAYYQHPEVCDYGSNDWNAPTLIFTYQFGGIAFDAIREQVHLVPPGNKADAADVYAKVLLTEGYATRETACDALHQRSLTLYNNPSVFAVFLFPGRTHAPPLTDVKDPDIICKAGRLVMGCYIDEYNFKKVTQAYYSLGGKMVDNRIEDWRKTFVWYDKCKERKGE